MVLALFVVWAGYFFHVSHLTVRDGTLTATFPNWTEPIVKPVRGHTNYSLLVPAGEYVEGFRELVRHNRHGQAAFFLGQVSSQGGWKMYYPTAILLKWPTVVLFLSLAGLMLALLRKIRCSGRFVDHGVFSRSLPRSGDLCPLQYRRPPRIAALSVCVIVCGSGVAMGRANTLRRTCGDRSSGIARRT